jgi:opacity protein-like surface antigen
MRTRLLMILVVVLLMGTPCFAATINVTVVAAQGWQSTGLNVTQGNSYGVKQTGGQWTVDHRNFPDVDGAGYSLLNDPKIFQGCKYKDTWRYGWLLGKIGNTIFPIGRVKSFTAPQSGVLELSIHDRCLGDNGGYLNVSIEEGLNVVGTLQRFTDSLVRGLTPAQRTRLLEVD